MLKKGLRYFMVGLLLSGLSVKANAQCENKGMTSDCMGPMNEYTYIKTINIEPEMFKKASTKLSFSYLFSKGTTYLITVCDKQASNKLLLDLYDDRQHIVARSYNLDTKKYYAKITYTCNASGLYHLKYSFINNGSPECGISVIGIQKKEKE